MRKTWIWTEEFLQRDEGAGVVEYGVLIALIIAICIATIILLGDKVSLGLIDFNNDW